MEEAARTLGPGVQAVLQAAVAGGTALSDEAPAALFIDLDRLARRAGELAAAFEGLGCDTAVHAFAVKANPVKGVLLEALRLGLGAECASLGEVRHALATGFPPAKLVYDSPCKTRAELFFCLQHGVYLNCDALDEVERVAEVLRDAPPGTLAEPPRVGLRINPQLGAGTIASTSTATATSKFGVTLVEHRAEIIAAFEHHRFLSGLHVHVGSQGCATAMMVAGVRAVVDLAYAVGGPGRVRILDIGGGLPVNYEDDQDSPDFATYAAELRAGVPELWHAGSGQPRWGEVVTEFGRSLVQKAGWVATKVEGTKVAGGRRIAVTHVGADLFVRTAYLPSKWKHRITVCDPSGAPRGGVRELHDVAGPLCFSGDLLAVGRELPVAEPGDWLVVHDAGGYTFALFSRYNSRPAPAVYGYRGATPGELVQFKARETWEDAARFWGAD